MIFLIGFSVGCTKTSSVKDSTRTNELSSTSRPPLRMIGLPSASKKNASPIPLYVYVFPPTQAVAGAYVNIDPAS
jgi:hypothetical protein